MVAYRPALARGLAAARLARPVPASLVRKGLRPSFRRGYAGGGDAHAASSDIPWIIGAVAVTVPGCYYLWPAPSHGDAHHGHDAHEEHHDEAEEAEPKDEEESKSEDAPEDSEPNAEESADSKDDQQEESKQESTDESKDDSKDDSKDESKDESSEKSEAKEEKPSGEAVKTSNKKVDGVQFKGKTSAGDENNEMHDFRKREPDGKGAFKKRIDSAYQKDLGAGEHKDEEGNPTGKTSTKPSGNPGAMDTKQAGISSTPTRHSTQIDQDPEKSKKGEGVPETAKSSTTVDPKRNQV